MDNGSIVGVVVASLLSGGTLSAIFALVKWRPSDEKRDSLVTASRGAVEIQHTVLRDLRTQLDALREQIAEQSAQIDRLETEVHQLASGLDAAVRERDQLKSENIDLRKRIGLEPRST